MTALSANLIPPPPPQAPALEPSSPAAAAAPPNDSPSPFRSQPFRISITSSLPEPDASLLTLYLAVNLDIDALAARTDLPILDLIAWADSPPIRAQREAYIRLRQERLDTAATEGRIVALLPEGGGAAVAAAVGATAFFLFYIASSCRGATKRQRHDKVEEDVEVSRRRSPLRPRSAATSPFGEEQARATAFNSRSSPKGEVPRSPRRRGL